jgi:hypothetical protein
MENMANLTRRELVRRAGVVAASLLAGPLVQRAEAWPRAHRPVDQFDADVAAAWFDLSLELVAGTPGYSPPVASRAFAYSGLTLYESLVPGMPGFRSLAGALPGLPRLPGAGRNAAYHWPSVANAALAAIHRALFPTAGAARLAAVHGLEAEFAKRFRKRVPPGIYARSVSRGRQTAAALFEWSRSDGGHEGYLRNFPPYSPPQGPGLWVPTPPAFQPALQPFWGANRCFAVAQSADCPPGDHPPYSVQPSSAFYLEAVEVYDAVNGLTPEQETIARFWSDDPGTTPTPPGHSISIATQVLRRERASLAKAAESYAKVGLAVADAFIACWYQKYVYNLLRPVTYIRNQIDPTWSPILVTPPFPEYPSGHSVQSGAAFQALTDLFGDGYAFVDRTHEARGFRPRRFGSFLEAAEEAAISRLYGGIHYRAAIDNGIAQGRCIGQAVSALPFRE